MKLNSEHFSMKVEPRKLKADILAEYERLKAKTNKTEYDEVYIKLIEEKLKLKSYKLVCTHLPSKIQKSWVKESEHSEVNQESIMREMLDFVRTERKQRRTSLKSTPREFGGAKYETIGGVLVKSNSINEIGKRLTVNDPRKPKMPRKMTNYIGVELEFNQNVSGENEASIAKAFTDAGLNKYVCVGTDGSCGWEVRVLLEEDDFVGPLTRILDVLNKKGFATDKRCGTHVHLDMRNRDVKKCYTNLFYMQGVLRKFISKGRQRNEFCRKNNSPDMETEISAGNRYKGINAQSYSKYKTLEVRMHDGTLDPNKLIPWIKLLLKIVNFTGALTGKIPTLKKAAQDLSIDGEFLSTLQKRLIDMRTKKGA